MANYFDGFNETDGIDWMDEIIEEVNELLGEEDTTEDWTDEDFILNRVDADLKNEKES